MRKPISIVFPLIAIVTLVACNRCLGPRSHQALTPIRNEFTSHLKDGGLLKGQFIINVPAHAAAGIGKPGLLLSFHADGRAKAGLWDDPGAVRRLAATGERFNLVTVLVQEPHGKNWWDGKVAENVQYVDDLISNYLFAKLAINRRHVFFAGVSGGADFAGGIFPVQTAFKYQGAALVTCGGDLPQRMLAPPPLALTPEQRLGFRYFFANVPDDPDFPPALVAKTAAYFRDLGFSTEVETVSHLALNGSRDFGTGHCSFDTPGWRDRFLERYFASDRGAG